MKKIHITKAQLLECLMMVNEETGDKTGTGDKTEIEVGMPVKNGLPDKTEADKLASQLPSNFSVQYTDNIGYNQSQKTSVKRDNKGEIEVNIPTTKDGKFNYPEYQKIKSELSNINNTDIQGVYSPTQEGYTITKKMIKESRLKNLKESCIGYTTKKQLRELNK